MATLHSKNQGGFTLIELMVVVLIVGLLAGIAVPRLAKAWDDAKASACQANMKQIEAALELYYFEEGKYPEGENSTALEKLKQKSVPKCPQGKKDYTYSQKNSGTKYSLECSNHHFIVTEESEDFNPSSSEK
jgi:type II secretion system protein G